MSSGKLLSTLSNAHKLAFVHIYMHTHVHTVTQHTHTHTHTHYTHTPFLIYSYPLTFSLSHVHTPPFYTLVCSSNCFSSLRISPWLEPFIDTTSPSTLRLSVSLSATSTSTHKHKCKHQKQLHRRHPANSFFHKIQNKFPRQKFPPRAVGGMKKP